MLYEMAVILGDLKIKGELIVDVQLADERDPVDVTTIDYEEKMISVVFSLWDHEDEDYVTLFYKDLLPTDRHPKIKEALAAQVRIEEELILKQYLAEGE